MTIEQDNFLKRYNFTQDQFSNTKLDWSQLEEIYNRHTHMVDELQSTANYISQRLQRINAVHSLKVRIKNAEHLVEKIIRKSLDKRDCIIELSNYDQQITDLIGIRALHLFKDEWRPIHEFVTSTWELMEIPVAYVREGDPKAAIKSLEDANCKVEEHPFGYRSIHYLIKSQPAKGIHLVELQVRTIFEEGWSEIDHQVRYPRQSSDPYLADFLRIFNRLAGSADEMGTFIKALSLYICEQTKMVEERDQLRTILNNTVSELKISQKEKQELQNQIDSLTVKYPPITLNDLNTFSGTLSGISNISSRGIKIGPVAGISAILSKTKCSLCGKPIKPSALDNFCEDCKKTLLTAK